MISMIACIDKNFGIGFKNKLLFNIKEDMKFFKETTMNHPIVMGYNTYKSIGKFLEGRENIVISDDKIEEPFLTMTTDEVLKKYENSEEEIFIIGGEKTYNDFFKHSKVLYITHVNDEKEADTYFPSFNEADYKCEVLKSGTLDELTEYHITKHYKG